MDLESYFKSHKKTHLIFDLDETILELILPWEVWERGIEDELKKIDPQILKDYKNRKINLNGMQNTYVAENPKVKKLLVENSKRFESENLKDIRMNQKLVNFIKESSGYQIYLWTSNTKRTAQNVLTKTGIFEKFTKIISCEDVKFLKPETEGFDLIWDGQTAKENYLFVGDSTDDKIAAQKAGIDFFQIAF
jgi:HAD superfamily hydrolase (TIGR01549 family)